MKILLSAKCSDMCSVTVVNDDGEAQYEETGYVPSYIPNWFADYIELEIDPKTGTILNWDVNEVQKFLTKLT